jgi:hypothetical protein
VKQFSYAEFRRKGQVVYGAWFVVGSVVERVRNCGYELANVKCLRVP